MDQIWKKFAICEKWCQLCSKLPDYWTVNLDRASDISRKKKQDFAGFSGANSWRNRPISRDFRGEKVKIRGTIGRFRGILAEKSQFSKDFRGKFLEKSADFTGNFGGKLYQETISQKTADFAGFFLENFAKIHQFCVDKTSIGERFF